MYNIQAFVTTPLDGNGATALAYDKKTGRVFIGADANEAGQNLISYTSPIAGTNASTMTPILAATDIVAVAHLAISHSSTDTHVLYTLDNDLKLIQFKTLNNLNTIRSAYPKDASNLTAGDTVALAASSNKVFAAVKPNSNADFGAFSSAISYIRILPHNFFTAASGFSSLPIDKRQNWIRGASEAGALNHPSLYNAACMCWNEELQRLYIGLQGFTHFDNYISTLVIARVNEDNALEAVPLIQNDHTAAFGNFMSPLGGKDNGGGIAYFSIFNLDVMKTSTGHFYIIINGGSDNVDQTSAGNKVYSLPLVDVDGDVPGSIAYSIFEGDNIVGVNFKSTIPGINNGHIYVGNSVLPVAPTPTCVTQLTAVGDTVFCATQATPDDDNEPGLYYSQAIFRPDGSIAQWTYWQKALPNNVTGDDSDNGSCKFFAVDPVVGTVWTVPVNSLTSLNRTIWNNSSTINSILNGPAYSEFSLHGQIANWGKLNKNRFVFIGTHNKVLVYRTAVCAANPTAYNNIEQPQSPSDDSGPIFISSGLENTGPIIAIDWTNQNTGFADNYLLAGTYQGLYALVNADDDNGIDIEANFPSTVSDFTSRTWKKITTISSEPVVKILSMNGTNDTSPVTFVLTHGATHKLWKISADGCSTLTALNARTELIWQSAPASNNSQTEPTFFHDIVDIRNDSNTNVHTVALLTNKGIFISQAPEGLTAANRSTNMTRAPLDIKTNTYTCGFTPDHTLSNHNIYAISQLPLLLQQNNFSLYSGIAQVNFNEDNSQATLNASGINLAQDSSKLPLSTSINAFYSDGAFRLFSMLIPNSENHEKKLGCMPYQNGINDYNTTDFSAVTHSTLSDVKQIYWIKRFNEGELAIGTENGIKVLS